MKNEELLASIFLSFDKQRRRVIPPFHPPKSNSPGKIKNFTFDKDTNCNWTIPTQIEPITNYAFCYIPGLNGEEKTIYYTGTADHMPPYNTGVDLESRKSYRIYICAIVNNGSELEKDFSYGPWSDPVFFWK